MLKFDLSQSDKTGLVGLARSLGLDWGGENLGLSLNNSFSDWFKATTPLKIGLKADVSSLKFNATLNSLPKGDGQDAWGKLNFTPSNALLYAQVPNAKAMINLPGNSILNSLENTLSVVAFPGNKEIDFAVIGKIQDKAKLEAELKKLKNIESQSIGRTEGAGIGYNESKVDDVNYYSITSADSPFVSTFGLVGENVVMGSNPEAFTKVLRVYQGREDSLSSQDYFKSVRLQLPPGSSGSLYLNFRQLKSFDAESLKKVLKPYFSLEIKKEFEPALAVVTKIGSLGVVWSEQGVAQGYLGLP